MKALHASTKCGGSGRVTAMALHVIAARILIPLAAALALASPVFAGESAGNEAAAESLFQEAKRLAAGGDFDGACPKFAESNRLSASVGALLSLGDCLEQTHKLASSWGAFVAAGILARTRADTARENEAGRRAALLSPRLAKLAIVVPPAARVPGFRIYRNGEGVGEAQFGSLMPADTGQHTIEARAPGYKTWSTTVRIETEGAAASVEIRPLDKLPTDVAPAVPRGDGGPQKTVGLAAVGVGVAGLVVGAITLGLDASTHASLAQQCPMGQCPGALQSTVNAYHSLGIVSSTALVAGGALAATGLVLVLTTPKTSPQPAGVSPVVGLGYVGLAGRF